MQKTLISQIDLATSAAFGTLTDGPTVPIDWTSKENGWDLTMAGNRSLQNPTNVIPGTSRLIMLKGSDATLRSLTFAANFKGDLPTIADATSTKWYLLMLFAYSATHIVVTSVKALP